MLRDWDHTTSQFKKYQLRYYHDAQPRQEGNTGKPNTSTLISAAEGNSLQYFNTVFDSAQPDGNNALVYGPYNGYDGVIQGSGVIGDVATDNYANAWLNHFYIYVDPATGAPTWKARVIPVWRLTRSVSVSQVRWSIRRIPAPACSRWGRPATVRLKTC